DCALTRGAGPAVRVHARIIGKSGDAALHVHDADYVADGAHAHRYVGLGHTLPLPPLVVASGCISAGHPYALAQGRRQPLQGSLGWTPLTLRFSQGTRSSAESAPRGLYAA